MKKRIYDFFEWFASLSTWVQRWIIIFLVGATVGLNALLKGECLAKALFGVPCPACGMTRAFLSLLTLDLSAAMHYNPAFWTVPLMCISGVLAAADKKRTKLWVAFFMLFVAVLLAAWIVRLFLGTAV